MPADMCEPQTTIADIAMRITVPDRDTDFCQHHKRLACQDRHAHAGELLECLKELLRVERQWLPEREGYSLYIRPYMFSSSHSIGISRPTRSTIAVILSPVGPYFATGEAPSLNS